MLAVEEQVQEPMMIGSELRQELATLPTAAIVILNAETLAAARAAVSVRKQFIKNAKAKLDPICDAAHKAWKAATGLRSEIIDPVEREAKRLGDAIVTYDNKLREEAERIKREADEAARRAEAEAQKRNAELNPWEEPEDVGVAVQQAVAKVEEKVAAVETVDGTRYKPWAGRVTDRKKFLEGVIANKRFDLIPWEQIDKLLRTPAQTLQKSMSDVIPGTEAYRDRIYSDR